VVGGDTRLLIDSDGGREFVLLATMRQARNAPLHRSRQHDGYHAKRNARSQPLHRARDQSFVFL
jgi:hypothetical protein